LISCSTFVIFNNFRLRNMQQRDLIQAEIEEEELKRKLFERSKHYSANTTYLPHLDDPSRRKRSEQARDEEEEDDDEDLGGVGGYRRRRKGDDSAIFKGSKRSLAAEISRLETENANFPVNPIYRSRSADTQNASGRIVTGTGSSDDASTNTQQQGRAGAVGSSSSSKNEHGQRQPQPVRDEDDWSEDEPDELMEGRTTLKEREAMEAAAAVARDFDDDHDDDVEEVEDQADEDSLDGKLALPTAAAAAATPVGAARILGRIELSPTKKELDMEWKKHHNQQLYRQQLDGGDSVHSDLTTDSPSRFNQKQKQEQRHLNNKNTTTSTSIVPEKFKPLGAGGAGGGRMYPVVPPEIDSPPPLTDRSRYGKVGAVVRVAGEAEAEAEEQSSGGGTGSGSGSPRKFRSIGGSHSTGSGNTMNNHHYNSRLPVSTRQPLVLGALPQPAGMYHAGPSPLLSDNMDKDKNNRKIKGIPPTIGSPTYLGPHETPKAKKSKFRKLKPIPISTPFQHVPSP